MGWGRIRKLLGDVPGVLWLMWCLQRIPPGMIGFVEASHHISLVTIDV
jgi:hypothetical protein